MTSTVSQSSKVIVRSSSYGTIDNYIIRSLLLSDLKKFHTFLNYHFLVVELYIGNILSDTVKESNNTMIKVLQEDPIGVTLTFDDEQMLKMSISIKFELPVVKTRKCAGDKSILKGDIYEIIEQILTDENNKNEQTDKQDEEENPLYESQDSFISEDIDEEM
ncbi:8807_t:CDS:2 [Diversispora eburnea]|uniref:8807_t:CDS:1 n=1 Tax=Diversispora eburnea TaxID=1213867 RepID=A0A9N9GGT7_9GLOM|nr:8807_t:CDS:2 [Diversispora eburnea]